MSTGSSPAPTPTRAQTGNSGVANTLVQYGITALIVVGMFVCLILGKVTQDVAIPVIVALGGVHVGSAITSNNTTP